MMNKESIWESGTTRSGSQYLVPIGFTLFVEDGVTINYESITVQGKIVFNGSASSPIICNALISGTKIKLESHFTSFNKKIALDGEININNCSIYADLLVSSGQVKVESCIVKGINFFKVYGKQTSINNCEFENCEQLSFSTNLTFTNNVVLATKKISSTLDPERDSISKNFALCVEVSNRLKNTIVVDRNVFRNLPVGIFLMKSGSSSHSVFSSKVLIIRNNDFYDNGICIVWSGGQIPAYVANNNFRGSSNYHLVSKNRTNKYKDKTKHDICKIGSNYFEREEIKLFDHKKNFNAVNRFKLSGLLSQPVTEEDKLSIPIQRVIGQVKRNQIPKKVKQFGKIFLHNYGFLLVIMSFCAAMTALGTYKVSNDSLYDSLFLVTGYIYQLFYITLALIGSLLGVKFLG